MKPLYQWLRYQYYRQALARSQRDLEMIESMFTSRQNQLLQTQDQLAGNLYHAYVQAKPIIAMWERFYEKCSTPNNGLPRNSTPSALESDIS